MSNIGELSLIHKMKSQIIPIFHSTKVDNFKKFKSKEIDLNKSPKIFKNYLKKKSLEPSKKNKIIEKTIKFLKRKYFLLNEKNINSKFFNMNINKLTQNNNNNFNTLNSNNSIITNITTVREDENEEDDYMFIKKKNTLKLNLINTDSKNNLKNKNKNKNENLSLQPSKNNENNKKNLIIFKSINKILNNSETKNVENSSALSSFNLNQNINYSEPSHKPIKIIKKNKIFGFKSTTKLNHYLICDYKTEESSDIFLSKQKLKLSEKTYNNIIKERNESIYKKSLNYYIEDDDRIKFYYNLYHNKTERNDDEKYTEKESKAALKKYYFNKKLENLKKRNKFFKKICEISETYENLNKSNKETINYNNLKRIIKLKKTEKNCMENNIECKKKKFQREHDEILLQTSKMIPSCLSKNGNKLKFNTISQFKMVNGLYFGVPS